MSALAARAWPVIGMTICGALILVVPFYWMLLVVLALFGFSMATLDVAMNAEASAVEEALERPIMSSLYGMFSIGRHVRCSSRRRTSRSRRW